MNNDSASISIEQAVENFELWRQTRTRLATPHQLKEQAVSLLDRHSTAEQSFQSAFCYVSSLYAEK